MTQDTVVGEYVRFLFNGEERRGTVEREEWEGVIRFLVIREKDTAIRRRVKPDAVLELYQKGAQT